MHYSGNRCLQGKTESQYQTPGHMHILKKLARLLSMKYDLRTPGGIIMSPGVVNVFLSFSEHSGNRLSLACSSSFVEVLFLFIWVQP